MYRWSYFYYDYDRAREERSSEKNDDFVFVLFGCFRFPLPTSQARWSTPTLSIVPMMCRTYSYLISSSRLATREAGSWDELCTLRTIDNLGFRVQLCFASTEFYFERLGMSCY